MLVTKRDWYEVYLAVAILGCIWIFLTRAPDAATADAAAAAIEQPRINFRAPDLALATLAGKTVSLADLRGQVVLLNFWATWCTPCRAEMPEIQNAYDKYQAAGLEVVAVNVAEEPPAASKFLQEFKLTFPVLLDGDSAATRRYQVNGLPSTFFIGRDGVIRATNLGAMNRAYIEAQLALLLEAP